MSSGTLTRMTVVEDTKRMKGKPKQKFPRGARVYIAKDLGSSMVHFECDQEAIVQYTYAQEYGWRGDRDNVKSYSLILLDSTGTKGVNAVSWYYEHQLTLVSDDVEVGKQIIEEYKYER